MDNLECPLCSTLGFYFLKTHCCKKSACDDCLFPKNTEQGKCPFCGENTIKKECVPEKSRNLLVASLYSVMSAKSDGIAERNSLKQSIDNLAYVVSRLIEQIREQDCAIRRLDQKVDTFLLGKAKHRSEMTYDAMLPPTTNEGEKAEEYLQIYVKTLTGTTFNINAPPSATVEDLKRFIESDCGIPVEHQRLIYAGEQLTDQHTLYEYDVRNGSSIHMVLQMRAHREPDEN